MSFTACNFYNFIIYNFISFPLIATRVILSAIFSMDHLTISINSVFDNMKLIESIGVIVAMDGPNKPSEMPRNNKKFYNLVKNTFANVHTACNNNRSCLITKVFVFFKYFYF